MKNLVPSVLFVAIIMLMCACNNDADVVATDVQKAPVNVTVNDFSMSVEAFSPRRSTQTAAQYSGVKVITLAFYDSNDAEFYKISQFRADNTTYTTFGEFSGSLPVGSYTTVVLV